jgi:LNS2 (Lipin/Ned1/Smp2)
MKTPLHRWLSASLVVGTLLAVACAAPVDSGEVSEGALTACAPKLRTCESSALAARPGVGFKHLSNTWRALGGANHRGRDLLLTPDDEAYAIGKFAYGIVDADLEDETVDVYLSRGCTGALERIGSVQTTDDNGISGLPSVPAGGGRAIFKLGKLPLGRHRVHMVAVGDGSSTDQIIEVLPKGASIVVSDVDGTLTTSEAVEFLSIFKREVSETHPFAPQAFNAFAERGYRTIYITARPDWLTGRTREFLKTRGFPDGVVHTSQSIVPQVAGFAAAFKKAEFEELRARGFNIAYAVGNTDSDADAFLTAGKVLKSRCKLFKVANAEKLGCTGFEDYKALGAEAAALPLCKL